jgi:phospholipid/cholesterol/gamma-HCH transport system permease protein
MVFELSLMTEHIKAIGSYGRMLKAVLRDVLFHGFDYKEVSRQIQRIGIESLVVVLITAIFSGMVLALQTAYGLHRFGAKNYVGNVVGLGIVRELGPVLTAIMVCGRAGAGIAAEIGAMVVTEQVDAIKALGANPIRKLVAPRIIAGMLVLPALVVFGDVVGIIGGQLIAVYELDQSAHMFKRAIFYTVLIRDVIDGLIKSAFFGFLITSIACFKGLGTYGGTEGVGRSTTAAVVIGCISIFIANFFITKFLLMLRF